MSGTVVLGYGPQPMDWLTKASKACGKGAVMAPDVARMAGANLAAGQPEALAALRKMLEAGALESVKTEHPSLSPAAIEWLAHGQRGTSSNTLFSHLTGVDAQGDWGASHPYDPADLNRCLVLLNAVPELRLSLPRMGEVSPAWAALIARWDEIEKSLVDEVGLGWTKGRAASKTYALMREVLSKAESA